MRYYLPSYHTCSTHNVHLGEDVLFEHVAAVEAYDRLIRHDEDLHVADTLVSGASSTASGVGLGGRYNGTGGERICVGNGQGKVTSIIVTKQLKV